MPYLLLGILNASALYNLLLFLFNLLDFLLYFSNKIFRDRTILANSSEEIGYISACPVFDMALSTKIKLFYIFIYVICIVWILAISYSILIILPRNISPTLNCLYFSNIIEIMANIFRHFIINNFINMKSKTNISAISPFHNQ